MGIKYLSRLRLGLSYLNYHKFRHNFQDCLNPLCPCSLELTELFIISCIASIVMILVRPS